VSHGAAIGRLPTSTRDGYVFKGWRTKAAKGAKVSAKTRIVRTSVFYAHWRMA
jgi:uncharacterized repeat protein (TIGR02543 family)